MTNEDTYDRSFGRYLDRDMRDRPHTAQEATDERATRGQGTVADSDQRPPRAPRGDDRGFGRYLT
ncbi:MULTISPECIES: hypothetical protein [Gordonia]|uniref:hypothetical protein n=1 Tax=Gordonia TaxID=2053 RepID=UPI00257FFF18|nr:MULTISPECIES: hypothetical protein [Gordonia]